MPLLQFDYNSASNLHTTTHLPPTRERGRESGGDGRIRVPCRWGRRSRQRARAIEIERERDRERERERERDRV